MAPSGLRNGLELEEVLIVLEGVHQPLPAEAPPVSTLHLLPPPPADPAQAAWEETGPAATLETDADRLRERYRRIGKAQGHTFGEGLPGSAPPDFTVEPEPAKPAAPGASGPPRPAP